MNTLVLGLGNVILQDEGVGVRVAQRLQSEYVFPEEVTVLDGGTLGLDLLHFLEQASRVVIVDAVKANLAPGSLVRLCDAEIPAFLGPKVSPHQIGLQDLLALAQLRGRAPGQIVLWGVQADEFQPGLDLSPSVAAQVETLTDCVIRELEQWGVLAEKPTTMC